MTSSRPSCSSCSRTSRSRSPRSAPSRPRSARSSSPRRILNGCAARALGSFLPEPSMPDPGAVLTRNWLHFGRILRGLGFDAGPARMLPFLTALTVIELHRADDLRTAVHIHFARRRDELAILHPALGAFLRGNAPRVESPSSAATTSSERGVTITGRQLKVLDDDGAAEGAEEQEVASYSQAEVLREKDFDTLTEAEMAEVRRLTRLMRLPAGLTRSRGALAGGRAQLAIRQLLPRSPRLGGLLLVFRCTRPHTR